MILKGGIKENETKKHEFNSINSYKPTGIYNENLLNKISDKLKNDS